MSTRKENRQDDEKLLQDLFIRKEELHCSTTAILICNILH